MSPQDPPWRKICPRETPIPLPELSETEDKEKGGPGTYEKHRQKDSGITVKYSKASMLQNTKDTASPCEQLLQTARPGNNSLYGAVDRCLDSNATRRAAGRAASQAEAAPVTALMQQMVTVPNI